MAVPYTFATATAAIPLSQLDSNFATTITLGNTAIQLGNTVTTLNNMTFANVTISSVSTAITPAQGGTGLTAVGTSGNVLTSNGTAWVSQAPAAATGNVTIGNTTIALGGTATSVGNLTLTNTTVTNYTESVVAIGNSSTSQTLSLTNGTVQTVTLTGNCTFTMPTATAGKSFILIVVQDGTGGRTATFTSVKWPNGAAPTITTTATTGRDILTFVSDGTNWYGTFAQNFS